MHDRPEEHMAENRSRLPHHLAGDTLRYLASYALVVLTSYVLVMIYCVLVWVFVCGCHLLLLLAASRTPSSLSLYSSNIISTERKELALVSPNL